MDVRINNHVDDVRFHPGAVQRVEKVGVEVIQRRHGGTVAVVADSGVHQHGEAVHLDDPGLDRDPPDVTFPERRRVVGA